jgi:hypothetical protein
MKTLRKSLICIAMFACAASGALAGPSLEAPTKFIHGDELYRVAVVKIAEITAEGRFRLEVIEPLRGETPDGLVVRVLGGGEGLFEVGRTYIVAHTDKPARRSYRWTVDPEGPRVLGIPAVGPAVFEDTAAMRELLGDHPEDQPLSDRARLDAVLDALGSSDVPSLRLVTAELALAPELRALVGEPELKRLRAVLESLEPMAHDYLLRASLPMVESWGTDWLAADARRLVSSYGPELDLTSLIPSLLVTALRTLAQTGTQADAEIVRAHVLSNNPGVGKAAFQALVSLDRSLAGEVAATIGDAENLHPDTLRFVRETAAREALESGAG